MDTNYTSSVNLPQNKTIHWRVRANGPNGPSLWTASRFISANPPSTPSLVSPSNAVTIKTLTPRLDWSTSTLPSGTVFLRYELEISTDTAFTEPIRKEVLERSASEWKDWAAEESLLPKTRYYWRVRAINADGHASNWSARRSFVTP
jgi:predicted phage tail protein